MQLMGILNTTPDSFYDGGKYTTLDNAIKRAEDILKEGASIIDIGGASSRPGASEVPQEEEFKRTIPIIRELKKRFPEAQQILIPRWPLLMKACKLLMM